MAKYSASVKIDVDSNLPKVSKEIKKGFVGIQRSAARASNVLIKNQESINRLAGSVKRLQIALVGVAAVGFGAAIKQGGNFQEKMKELSAITGLEGRLLDNFGDDALEMSKKFGISAGQYVEGVKLVASARPELLEQPTLLKKITDQSLLLAKASKMNLASSVDAVTTSMGQFGLEALETERIINVLAAGSKFGASEVEATATALKKSGGVAKLAGVSFEETNALLQIMASEGKITSEIAGTQLKTALISLSTATDAFNPKVVGISKALKNLQDVNLDVATATEIFGREAVAGGLVLVNNADKVDSLVQSLTNTSVATEQARKNMQGFNEASRRLGSTVNAVLIKAFIKMEPKLTSIVESFSKFISDEKKMTRAIKIGKIALAGLIGVIVAATAAQIALNIAMIANPVGLVIVAIAAGIGVIAAGIAALAMNWNDMSTSAQQAAKVMIAAFSPVVATVAAINEALGLYRSFKAGDLGISNTETVERVYADTSSPNRLNIMMKIDKDGNPYIDKVTKPEGVTFGLFGQGGMMPSF